MAAEPRSLIALALPGLRPDTLGNYLASLGLLRILARRWPDVRACWHDEAFHLVGGPATIDEMVDVLADEKHEWTPYERRWADAQERSTKSGKPLALWQASAEENELELLAAHVVPAARLSFNPMLGSGGNAGRRNFSEGWKRAIDALKPKKRGSKKSTVKAEDDQHRKRAELKALVLGEPTSWMLAKLNAASWFGDANKLYNSGQGPSREGTISPWAMVLACEGLPFFAGGASRRLGARAQAVGAFPFVTRAAAPCVSGEAGRDRAEVWAPLWERPMTLREVVALFGRGRAEVRGRGASTPGAFATAIVRRGVDAGISEFRRFVLGRTTSAHTFEPRFEGIFRLTSLEFATAVPAVAASAASTTVERMLGLIDRLPVDRKVRDRWRFFGLRGPIETAMLRLTANFNDPGAARALLDAAVSALDRVDRNQSFRKRIVAWEPLPIDWLPALFADESPGVEARLALALVSSFPQSWPFVLYRFGVVGHGRRFVHPERAPSRWVWHAGVLPSVLADVLRRRTLDWEGARDDGGQARSALPAASADVSRWFSQEVDNELLACWASRLALFDWRFIPSSVRKSLAQGSKDGFEVTGLLCLFGLVQPLFDLRPVRSPGASVAVDLLPCESGARTPAAAQALANLVRGGQIEAAVRLAQSRYAMAGAPLARTDVPWQVAEPERLLSAVLFAVPDRERTRLVQRWLRPRRQQGKDAHA